MPWTIPLARSVVEKLDGAGERPPIGQDLAEDLAVTPLERLGLVVGQAPPDLARDRAGEQAAAHPDPAVDPPAIDRMAGLGQRALPGEHVRVDGVHEGPVEIEDEGTHQREYGRIERPALAGRPFERD